MSALPEEPQQPHRIRTAITERQQLMIDNQSRVLFIGAGTKTGKSIGLALWIAQGLLLGQKCAWCGPWSAKTRMGYELIKHILKYAVAIGEVHCNDSTMRITTNNGGRLEPYTGDNPEAIFGSEFNRFVIDEASRQKSLTLTAAVTTVSAIGGKVKLAFNLDHGSKNWAIQKLLYIQALTPEQRKAEDVDYMLFPTMSESFVPLEEIERIRKMMPGPMFEALYHAKIPESDVSLFQHLDMIFSGPVIPGPERGHSYIMGVDLARKQNFTVATVLDVTRNLFVDAIRFTEISWTLQYDKIAELSKKWGCAKVVVDETGIGDPAIEELRKKQLPVEGVIFTRPVRKALIELLVVGCDGREFTITNDARFHVHRHELEQFQYQLDQDDGTVTYGPPEHEHDDCVFSLALAWRGAKLANFGRPRIMRGDTTRIHVADLSGF